ncbi:thiamine-binding protein [Hyperthermus butylicus]|uniref:Universally conserved protein n=1 Tax=Hyperthermus butylicus (strain DSM 5456 / JCM 9403 / PLM1-5) TaxID=415426 RepID=A2BLP5_HYPBU|nr:thiamine-binding protein [Hyperthermus butylicus]ABM80906.1 universally conserved protein [Hyperthermus butylicus DSM 5456]
MPTVSIKVIPIGVGPSLSRYIARVVALLEAKGYKPLVTPDTTVIQVNDVSEIGPLVRMIHDELYSMGVARVLTIIMIDERRDVAEAPPQAAVEKVLARLQEERKKFTRDVHGVI